MKTYKYLVLVLMSMTIVNCSDLEEEPVSLLTPEGFFTSVTSVQTAANAAYGHIGHEDFWGRKMPLTLILRSDMVAIGDPTTATRRIEHDNLNVPTNNAMIDGYWTRVYQVIASSNNAIAGAALVNAAEEDKNPVAAQAYFTRAFAYFHLVRQFGDIPYLDKLVTDLKGISSTMSKTPAAEVYDNIIADLEFAKKWLPDTQEARSLPAKSAAHSYLALVYLTIGEYEKAYEEAKGVIDNEGPYQLGLEPDYQNLFNADKIDASLEPIFAVDFNGFRVEDAGHDYLAALTGCRNDEQHGLGGGWSVAVPSLAVFNAWDDQDYRKEVSLDVTGVFNGATVDYTVFKESGSSGRGVNRPHIAKYTRFPGTTAVGNGRASSHNYSMIRYAEVLLIAAEALNEISGGSGEAHDYVNRVRARARNGAAGSVGSAFPEDISGLSQDELRKTILDERKWELSFEAKRWYDIVRRKMGTEVFGASGFEGLKEGFDPNQDYLFPLPADELARNPNLLPNNPGY